MKATICLLLGGFVLGVLFQGGLPHFFAILFIAEVWLAPCLLVMTGMAIFGFIRDRPPGPSYRQVNTLLGVSILSLILSYALGCGILQLRLSITHHHVAAMIPALEAEKKDRGSYPKTVPAQPDCLYSALGFPLEYSSSGNAFVFQHDNPAGIMDGYKFSSDDRTWRKVGY